MNDLFLLAAHNTVVVLVLALFVHGLTRLWRHPPVAHVLWVLVLLKLLVPPVVRIDWPAISLPASTLTRSQDIAGRLLSQPRKAESHAPVVDWSTERATITMSAVRQNDQGIAESLGVLWNRGGRILFWLWIVGAVLCGLVVGTRIVNFERYLRNTLPASERLRLLTIELAARIGVRRVPDVRYVEGVATPFLWCAGGRSNGRFTDPTLPRAR